jgi:DNA invertase Pin-like site-specific DNA recombinase
MPGMTIGYARSSTTEQEAGYDAQVRDLKAAGCERVFGEKVSSIGNRPQLDEALRFVREGDTIVVTKPDRLARSIVDLLRIVSDLKARKVGLRVLSMGLSTLDSSNPTTALTLSILGSVAEFERAMMLERQREGIAKAKADGKYPGRQPTARAKSADIVRMAQEGKTRDRIAMELKVSRASVYRVLADARLAV